MRKVIIMAIAGAMVGGGAVAANRLARESSRPDCPGKIICPLTGDLICADECPLEEAGETSLPVSDEASLPACCASRAAESK